VSMTGGQPRQRAERVARYAARIATELHDAGRLPPRRRGVPLVAVTELNSLRLRGWTGAIWLRVWHPDTGKAVSIGSVSLPGVAAAAHDLSGLHAPFRYRLETGVDISPPTTLFLLSAVLVLVRSCSGGSLIRRVPLDLHRTLMAIRSLPPITPTRSVTHTLTHSFFFPLASRLSAP
jgi:hypothetical protein